MNIDDILSSLAHLPRPHLSSSFPASTAARATKSAEPRRLPIAFFIYWLFVVFIGGSTLTTSWAGVAVMIAVITVMAFPRDAARVVMRGLSPFLQ